MRGSPSGSPPTARRACAWRGSLLPAAVLLDVLLPRLDGWDVLAHLKADPRPRRCPSSSSRCSTSAARRSRSAPRTTSSSRSAREEVLDALHRCMRGAGRAPRTVVVIDDDPRRPRPRRGVARPRGLQRPARRRAASRASSSCGASCPRWSCVDLLMPGLDGFAVVERLRADPATADVPVVVLTAKDMTAGRPRAAWRADQPPGARRARTAGRSSSRSSTPSPATARDDRRGPAVTGAPLILVVEDNERNLKLVRDVLEHHGYRTLGAADGEGGVALAREHLPALTLMDVQLPGIDGVEALGRLRGDPRTAALRVVALTAFAMTDDRERLLAAGFDGYLVKPIDVRDVPGRDRVAAERRSGGRRERDRHDPRGRRPAAEPAPARGRAGAPRLPRPAGRVGPGGARSRRRRSRRPRPARRRDAGASTGWRCAAGCGPTTRRASCRW